MTGDLLTIQTGCRGCGAPGLTPILSLGSTPLANRLLTEEQLGQVEPRYPLTLALCRVCTLVQLLETVAPTELFSDYVYFSSFSDTMLRHASDLVSDLVSSRKLGRDSLAVELASNDGYLLQYFVSAGVPVLGIDPAANVAKVAQGRGVRTVVEFFGERVARTLRDTGESADVIIGINVLGHVADLNGFVRGIKTLLKPEGVVVIEVPYVKDMIDRCEFDTIYHEHLHYFSVTALERLFSRHGLTITDVAHIAIHGGTLRVTANHSEAAGDAKVAPLGGRERVRALLADEAAWNDEDARYYESFAGRVNRLKLSLTDLLDRLKSKGSRIAAYGAAAKGSTLLSYCGIGANYLEYVVDRSTYKQGRFMPGSGLPILAPERLAEDRPEYVLMLTWNFADEIMRQQSDYIRQGGRFVIPVPEPRIVP